MPFYFSLQGTHLNITTILVSNSTKIDPYLLVSRLYFGKWWLHRDRDSNTDLKS